jgi:hypothetical protein
MNADSRCDKWSGLVRERCLQYWRQTKIRRRGKDTMLRSGSPPTVHESRELWKCIRYYYPKLNKPSQRYGKKYGCSLGLRRRVPTFRSNIKLRGLKPQTNCTDRATAVCWRS